MRAKRRVGGHGQTVVEHAIGKVQPGHRQRLAAVRFAITVFIAAARKKGRISENGSEEKLPLKRDGRIVLDI